MITDKIIYFNKFYKQFNIISIVLIFISLGLLIFKGLNYGVDFKGGTLIELRVNDTQTNISNLRKSFLNMNLGDVNIKEFGKEGDYLIKIEQNTGNDSELIPKIKKTLINNFI